MFMRTKKENRINKTDLGIYKYGENFQNITLYIKICDKYA